MKRDKRSLIAASALLVLVALILWLRVATSSNVYEIDQPGNDLACNSDLQFAVIGDFGKTGQPLEDVAALVEGWQPDFIVTVGDNNYPDGTADTIDHNIGRYFSNYIYPYKGQYGSDAAENRFFPSLGNHDWRPRNAQPYLDYFTLPGNERYYDVRKGPVHLFILDSEEEEPDGRDANSVQAQWLAEKMAGSNAPWKLVILHRPPYSSGAKHGSAQLLQWDFAAMGATAVLAGHDHLYERLIRDDILYFVNGLGGYPLIYDFAAPLEGSAVRYNQDYGAMLLTADANCLNFSFHNRAGELIDSHSVTHTDSFAYLPLVIIQ